MIFNSNIWFLFWFKVGAFSFCRFKEKHYGSSGATSGLSSSLAFTPVQVCYYLDLWVLVYWFRVFPCFLLRVLSNSVPCFLLSVLLGYSISEYSTLLCMIWSYEHFTSVVILSFVEMFSSLLIFWLGGCECRVLSWVILKHRQAC